MFDISPTKLPDTLSNNNVSDWYFSNTKRLLNKRKPPSYIIGPYPGCTCSVTHSLQRVGYTLFTGGCVTNKKVRLHLYLPKMEYYKLLDLRNHTVLCTM